MNTRRSVARREEGGVSNERVHPRIDQVFIVGLKEENEEVPLQEPQNSGLHEDNPPTFHGTKVDEDPQGFIDEVFKVVYVMGVTPREKAELAAYQLKDVSQVWFEQWRIERPLERGPVDWEEFKEAFQDKFFPLEWREKNMVEFMNLCQGGMSVQEYSLKFTQLSKYAPSMVDKPRARMNKFVMGVSSLVEKERRTAMLLNDMDISRLMVYAQPIEESKIREIRQEGKRPRSDDSSHQKTKKRFDHQDASMGNKDRAPNQNSQGDAHSFERTRCPTCGKQHLGRCLASKDG
ncbi:uncharacterized protein [Solanum lycopersicum]|uniref:uncharacterized protein n=1 Tax=Solanum lycopersicum TaxID=4081 RepID=UPI003748666A